MKYARPPFPISLFKQFCDLATSLGWGKRGERWKFLAVVLDYVKLHSDLFRRR